MLTIAVDRQLMQMSITAKDNCVDDSSTSSQPFPNSP